MKNSKTHYRKVFKSDHLSSFDLEDFIETGVLLEFTIKEVRQFEKDDNNKKSGISVAGKMIAANIAYFEEPIKPLVLNATNSSILAKITGSNFIDYWKNVKVELYILKNIRFGKETVDGIRIKEEQPKGLSETDIKVAKGRIAACVDLQQLTDIYNSNLKYKTNQEIIFALKEKSADLKSNL